MDTRREALPYNLCMASLVLELQQEAANGSTSLPDVLRKARMVATKLKLADMNAWIEKELHGYSSDVRVPDYRVLHGDLRARNPYNGCLMPIRFGAKLQDEIARVEVRQSIGSLHDVINGSSDDVQVALNEHVMAILRPMFEQHTASWIQPFNMFSKPQVSAIFEAVRNQILDWTLKLESEGILGEGMTFTPQEKNRAASITSIRIGSVENFQGVIGSMTESTLHIDNVAAVDGALKSRGFSNEERNAIQQLIAEHKAAPAEGKLAVAKRGVQWVVDHAEKLGTLAGLFRDFFVP